MVNSEFSVRRGPRRRRGVMGGGFFKIAAVAAGLLLAANGVASAEPCPGHPDAIGTSRTLVLNPAEAPRVGTLNHGSMLPLAPGEVVLSFDDGPRSPTTQSVLETLAAHCVKATFFMIGRNAKAEPQVARLVLAAGHTVGSHTQNHPRRTMAPAIALREIDTGILNVSQALGDPHAVAPFFRFPGLHHTAAAEQHLRVRSISAWSIDVDSHDWKRIAPEQVLDNVLTRLAAKGRGIILLHDVQPRTAQILPLLLAELKQRGYRIVHVVPAQRPWPAPSLMAAVQAGQAKEAIRRPIAGLAASLQPTPAVAARRPVRVARARLAHHAKPARSIRAAVATPHHASRYR